MSWPYYIFLVLSLVSSLALVPTHAMLELYKPTCGFLIWHAVSYLWAAASAGTIWCQGCCFTAPLPSACRVFIHLSGLDQPLRKLTLLYIG